MFRKATLATALLALFSSAAAAQSANSHNPDDERGLVSFSEFAGTFNADSHVVKLDTSVGYNLNSHFGADFGVPFYFTGGTAPSTTGSKTSFSATGMGAPYLAFRGMYKDDTFRYASRFVLFLPAGDATNGLSSGQTSIDWINHFENGFGRVTPFGDVGVANTVGDTARYKRAYTSYGNNFHVEGGATVDVTDKVSVGGSAYDIFPWGTQTIYSRAVPKGSMDLPARANGKTNAFQQNSYIQGASDLAKDNGASAWADYSPAPYMTVELGFTRSFEFQVNTVSVGMRLNLGYLAKARSHR